MNMGRGKWLRVWIQICPLRLALSGVRHFKQHICSRDFTYQYSYSLVVHIAEDHELLHSTSTKSSRCTRSISRTLYRNTGRAHTSCTHFNWIFELMSSLRSHYALYRDTMPLIKVRACFPRIIHVQSIKNKVTALLLLVQWLCGYVMYVLAISIIIELECVE